MGNLHLNSEKQDIGPGSFKLDSYLITTGGLNNTCNGSIYEANIYTTGIKEITDAYYGERNKKQNQL